jgi:hypothetical protein
MGSEKPLTLESYLEQVGQCCGSAFGLRYRKQFRDNRGTAELAMLAAPSREEYQDFCRVVEAMTEQEKGKPEDLSDQQMDDIAKTAGIEKGNLQIFINGFLLAKRKCRKTEQ